MINKGFISIEDREIQEYLIKIHEKSDVKVIKDFEYIKDICSLLVVNKMESILENIEEKIYTRDFLIDIIRMDE